MSDRRVHISIPRGEAEIRRATRALVDAGSTAEEKRRFAHSTDRTALLSELDHLIELVGSKRMGGGRSPVLAARRGPGGGVVLEGPFPYLLGDYSLQRIGARLMERLWIDDGDRERRGQAAAMFESMILTEACIALQLECRARGLTPEWDPDEMRRQIEARLGLEREAPDEVDARAKAQFRVESYGPIDPETGRKA